MTIEWSTWNPDYARAMATALLFRAQTRGLGEDIATITWSYRWHDTSPAPPRPVP